MFSDTPNRHEESNYIIVTSLEELKFSRWWREWYVYAVCPKCGDGWTSRPANAEKILKNGCSVCAKGTKDDWQPTIDVIVHNN